MSKVLAKQNQKCNRILKTTFCNKSMFGIFYYILAITKSVFHSEENLNKAKASYIIKVKISNQI